MMMMMMMIRVMLLSVSSGSKKKGAMVFERGDDGAPVVVEVEVEIVLLYFSRGRRWCPRASTGGEGLAAAAMLLQRSTSRSIPTPLLG